MSKISLHLRLYGKLPTDREINELIGIPATTIIRKGDVISAKTKRVQQADVWKLDLTPKLNFNSSESEVNEHFLQAAILLEKIALNIANLNRDTFSAEFYISSIREEERGIFSLPQELVNVLAIAKLSINMSILIMLSDDD